MKRFIPVCGILLVSVLHASAAPRDDVVTAGNRFALTLFDILMTADQKANVFISPVSVDMALSMALNGARGDTAKAMTGALSLSAMTLADIDSGNQNLIETLAQPVPHLDLIIANGLWVRDTIKPDFVQLSQTVYKAELGNLSGAPVNINNWVNDKTRGKITNILAPGSVTPQTQAILVNAVYFKGDWRTPFDRSLTQEKPFTSDNGATQPSQMMQSRQEKLPYLKTDTFEMVALPYANGEASMILIHPDAGSTPEAAEKTLVATPWKNWMERLSPTDGTVHLPRLHSEYQTELAGPLTALGMGAAFSKQADFSGLSQQPVHIDAVIHKTYLDVSEEGTTAAAATGVVMRSMASIRPKNPFDLVFDHPFIAAIVDNRTGAILFLGAIEDPGTTG